MPQQKPPNRVETGLQNGINWLHQQLSERIDAGFADLKKHVETVAGYPDRLTDRILLRIMKSKHSYLLWFVWAFTVVAGASIWKAL